MSQHVFRLANDMLFTTHDTIYHGTRLGRNRGTITRYTPTSLTLMGSQLMYSLDRTRSTTHRPLIDGHLSHSHPTLPMRPSRVAACFLMLGKQGSTTFEGRILFGQEQSFRIAPRIGGRCIQVCEFRSSVTIDLNSVYSGRREARSESREVARHRIVRSMGGDA